MASPYILSNTDIQYTQTAGQNFQIFLAFLNPISITTNWVDIGKDPKGNWLVPQNFDTAANHVAPYQPTANLGPNRIGFVGEPLYFDGTRSCQRFDLPVTSYSWTTSGTNQTVTLYDNGSQMGVSWNAPGLYTVTLQVTDRANVITYGTRQVMIYQDRQSALPGMITLSGPSGSLSNGGWQCQLTTVNSQFSLFPPDALPVGTFQPIVIMAETSYEVAPGLWINRTIGPNGQFNPGYPYQDPRIVFDGYVQQGTIHQDVDKDTLSCTCVGPQMILQITKAHTMGYYNCSYTGYDQFGIPKGCHPSPIGQGFQVGGLMSQDIVHSVLQYHSNFAVYHDIHTWNAGMPTVPYIPGGKNAYYNLQYSTLGMVEGTIWQNLQNIAQNEWSDVFCERDGGLRIGPMVNYRGSDYWSQPQLLGQTVVASLINFIQDLGFNVGSDMSQMPNNMPILPSLPMPVKSVHPWGIQTNPPKFFQPFQPASDPTLDFVQQGLFGPPILCTFSDVPSYDPSPQPPPSPGALFPWIYNNWPQDLSVYPISFDIQENYIGKAALVKLIGTPANPGSTQWVSWYPQNAFQVVGTGLQNIVTAILPAGDWIVDESHVLPDITLAQQKTLMTNWWWEIVRRMWYANNINFQATVTLGMFTVASLGDIVSCTRQNGVFSPGFLNKPFYVDGISYAIDFTNRTWQTSISLNEVTSAALGPPIAPPPFLPK